MKKIYFIIFVSLFICNPLFARGNGFPVPKDGQSIPVSDSDDHAYLYTSISLSDIEVFYQHEFQDDDTINWRKSDDNGFIIDDWGNRDWHKITVIDNGKDGIQITVQPDKWTWIIGTLVIRFIGVLIVLSILMFFIYVSGSIFKLTAKAKKADA
ncbi:MAG: hypothetical protein JW864_01605 [Spirochaetes bacterium]|nr:hypothetical protein [Spirochaetota bacterium]